MSEKQKAFLEGVIWGVIVGVSLMSLIFEVVSR